MITFGKKNRLIRYLFLRHPSEYFLVAKTDSDYENPVNGYKHLRRLCPTVDKPEDYDFIYQLNGQFVYKENGKLKPKFMSLRRIVK